MSKSLAYALACSHKGYLASHGSFVLLESVKADIPPQSALQVGRDISAHIMHLEQSRETNMPPGWPPSCLNFSLLVIILAKGVEDPC